jgi:hypothetical protein
VSLVAYELRRVSDDKVLFAHHASATISLYWSSALPILESVQWYRDGVPVGPVFDGWPPSADQRAAVWPWPHQDDISALT